MPALSREMRQNVGRNLGLNLSFQPKAQVRIMSAHVLLHAQCRIHVVPQMRLVRGRLQPDLDEPS